MCRFETAIVDTQWKPNLFKYNSCVGSSHSFQALEHAHIHLNTTLVSVRETWPYTESSVHVDLNTTLVSVRAGTTPETSECFADLNTTLVSVREAKCFSHTRNTLI